MCKSEEYGRCGCLNYECIHMQRWYVIIFLKIWPTSNPKLSMRHSLYCIVTILTFSRCMLIPITQITSKSQYPSKLPSQQKWHTSAPIYKINCSWYMRGYSDIDCKLNMDGSMNCCVSLLSMHNIVYYQSNIRHAWLS